MEEGCLEAAGAVLSVQKAIMGYVIHNSRGRGACTAALGSLGRGVWTKMRWWGVRWSVPTTCSPRLARVTSST